MKKLFLFLAVSTLALTSCSSDDDGGNNAQSFTFTVNGVQKTFSNIVVNEEVGEDYVDLTVTAFNSANPSEVIVFDVEEGDLGVDAVWSFTYSTNGEIYFYTGSAFNIIVTQNANNRLKGTFTGTLYRFFNSAPGEVNPQINLTNGNFDFGY